MTKMNPESSSFPKLLNITPDKERRLSNENAFSSPKGLAYTAVSYDEEEHQNIQEMYDEDEEEIDLNLDEDLKNQILANIYSKTVPQ